jgi:uncharacterized protein YndB with AHSA1/START domain
MLTFVALGLVALVALLLVLVARRPADYYIERETTIAAPPGAVLDLVEDFRQWNRWSPWDRLDPTQVVTLGGAPRGVGATYEWVGKKNGQGRMEIVEHRPNELVGIQLDFIKPFPSRSRCDFRATPSGGGTRLVWSMTGRNDFMGKAFDLFMNMDRMLGRDFSRGLAALKEAAESSAGAPVGAPRVSSEAGAVPPAARI